jgi:hypothetical protein
MAMDEIAFFPRGHPGIVQQPAYQNGPETLLGIFAARSRRTFLTASSSVTAYLFHYFNGRYLTGN